MNKCLFSSDRALKTDQKNKPTHVYLGESMNLLGLLIGDSWTVVPWENLAHHE